MRKERERKFCKVNTSLRPSRGRKRTPNKAAEFTKVLLAPIYASICDRQSCAMSKVFLFKSSGTYTLLCIRYTLLPFYLQQLTLNFCPSQLLSKKTSKNTQRLFEVGCILSREIQGTCPPTEEKCGPSAWSWVAYQEKELQYCNRNDTETLQTRALQPETALAWKVLTGIRGNQENTTDIRVYSRVHLTPTAQPTATSEPDILQTQDSAD